MNTSKKLFFATSGIRGKANTDISPELVLQIGQAVSDWVRKNQADKTSWKVYVGYDNRRNSKLLAYTLATGVTSLGVDVIMTKEPVPTPLLIHATIDNQANAGVMITGSHLPAMDNGVILFDGEGNYYKGILPDATRDLVDWKDLGKLYYFQSEVDEYRSFLLKISKNLGLQKFDWKVAIDPAHGVMKQYLYDTLSPLFREIIKVNWKDDDTFPGRISEPIPGNLGKTCEIVVEENCDIGITTDMDGDRVIYISSNGKVISGDYIGALFAQYYWKENKEYPVIVPINTSGIILHVTEKMNGNMIFCKVGPPSIILGMRANQAVYGFEETGKYIFTKHGLWPDAVISTLMLFSLIQKTGKTIDELIQNYPTLYALKTKTHFSRSDSPKVMENMKPEVEKEFDEIKEINDMDGLRITFQDNSWLLIRPSGTEDYIRVFSEHTDERSCKELNDRGRKLIEMVIEKLGLSKNY